MSSLDELISHDHQEVQQILSEENRPSVFEDYGDFKVLVLRRMLIQEDKLVMKAESFLIKEDKIYYFDKQGRVLSEMGLGFADLLKSAERFYRQNQKIISRYAGGVESLETNLFERSLPSYFLDLWFDLKKELSKIEHYYYRNAIVYREFLKNCHRGFGELSDEFKDIEEDIQFQVSSINALKTRLDSIYDYFGSLRSERLNKTLLTLTVISGIFLPLNLIVGFFGMNTPGLYFSKNPDGTQQVVTVLIGVVLVCLLGFKVLQLIDRYILRFILGRYDFYKNLSSQLEDLGSRIKGKY